MKSLELKFKPGNIIKAIKIMLSNYNRLSVKWSDFTLCINNANILGHL